MKKEIVLTAQPRWDASRGYWKINVQHNHVRRSFYSSEPGKKGKRMAQIKATKWLQDGCTDDPYLYEALGQFLKDREKTCTNGTYMSNVNYVRNWIKPNIVDKRLSKVTDADWQLPITRAVQNGHAKSTCVIYLNFCSMFVTFCRKHRYQIDEDSLKLVQIPTTAAGKAKKRSLQPRDLKILFSSTDTMFRGQVEPDWFVHAYRFCAIIGLRRGELAGIEWADIKDGVLHVERSVNRNLQYTPGKNDNANRVIYLPEKAKAVLEEQKAMLNEYGIISKTVFPNIAGCVADPNELYRAWKRYCAFNGIPDISFHEIRHTTISMYRGSIDVSLLKQAVGHSASMDTYGIYGHAFDGKQKHVADVMDNVIRDIIG